MNTTQSARLFVVLALALLALFGCTPKEVSYNDQGQRVLTDVRPTDGMVTPIGVTQNPRGSLTEISSLPRVQWNRLYRIDDPDKGNSCYYVSHSGNGAIALDCVKDAP